MLVAVARWREHELAERPLYLSAPDIRALRELIRPMTASDVMVLLPIYSAGDRALEAMSINSICAISTDGEVEYWNGFTNSWGREASGPLYALWLRKELSKSNQSGDLIHWKFTCLPAERGSWSGADTKGVVAFLDSLLVETPPLMRSVEAEQLVRQSVVGIQPNTDPLAAAGLIVLVQHKPSFHVTYPLLLRSGQDITAVSKALLGMKPQHLLSVVPEIAPKAALTSLDQVCLISADGRFLDFLTLEGKLWPTETVPEKIAASYRNELVNAVREYRRGYMDSYVCSLQQSQWSAETRAKVIAFLERIKITATKESEVGR